MAAAAARDDATAMLQLWSQGAALPANGLGPAGRALRAVLDTTGATTLRTEPLVPPADSSRVQLDYAATELLKEAVRAGFEDLLTWAIAQPGVNLDDVYRVGDRARLGLRPLHVAAQRRDTLMIRQLLAAGADPFAPDARGRSAFRFAVDSAPTAPVLRALAGPEARLGLRDDSDFTTLEWLIAEKPQWMAMLLLDAGARVERSPSGWDALHFAARDGKGAVLYRLLKDGAAPDSGVEGDYRPLLLAAHNNRVYEALTLVQFGADPRRPGSEGSAIDEARAAGHLALGAMLEQLAPARAARGRRPAPDPALLLSLAARAGSEAHVADLLRARTPARGAPGLPPVPLAASRGHYDLVFRLIAAGADADATDSLGASALIYAARDGYYDAVARLLRMRVQVDRIVEGHTALHLAVSRGQWYATMALVNAGASRTLRNPQGQTAAEAALARGDTLLARFIDAPSTEAAFAEAAWAGLDSVIAAELRRGVSANSRSQGDIAALVLAAEQGRAGVLQQLLAAGANLRGEDGTRALAAASARGDSAMVERLLAAGASVDGLPLQDSPLFVAVQRRRQVIAEMLVRAGADPAALGDNAVLISWGLQPLAAGVPRRDVAAAASVLGLRLESEAGDHDEDPRAALWRAVLQRSDVMRWPQPFVARAAVVMAGAGWTRAYEAVEPALDSTARAQALVSAASAGHTELLLRAFSRGASPAAVAEFPVGSGQQMSIAAAAYAGRHGDVLAAAMVFGARLNAAEMPELDRVGFLRYPSLAQVVATQDRAGAVAALVADEAALLMLRELDVAGKVPALPPETWARTLDAAVAARARELARGLIQRGVPETRRGLTAQLELGRAASLGNVALLRRLLADGVDPRTPLLPGMSALEEAVLAAEESSDGETVLALLAAGADASKLPTTTLLSAARSGQERAALALLAAGAPTGGAEYDGRTVVDVAAARGEYALVRALLARGVPLKADPDSGQGGFERAVRRGHSMLALALACANAPGRARALAAAAPALRRELEAADCSNTRVQLALAIADSAHRIDLERTQRSAVARRTALMAQRAAMRRVWGDSTEAVRRIEALTARSFADAGGANIGDLQLTALYYGWPAGSPDAVTFRLERARMLRARGIDWGARNELDALATLVQTRYRRDQSAIPLGLVLRVLFERVELLAEQGDITEAERMLLAAVELVPFRFGPEVLLRASFASDVVALGAGRPTARAGIAGTRAMLDSTAVMDRPQLRARLFDLEARAALRSGDRAAARALWAQALHEGREAWGVESGHFAAVLVRAAALAAQDSSSAAGALIALSTRVTEEVGTNTAQVSRVRLEGALAGQRVPGRRFTLTFGAAGFLGIFAKTEVEQLPLASRWPYLDLNYALVRDALLGPLDAAEAAIVEDEMIYERLAGWKGLLLESLRMDQRRVTGSDDEDLLATLQQLESVRRSLSSWTARRPTLAADEWQHGLRRLTQHKEELERTAAEQANRQQVQTEDPLGVTAAEDLRRALGPDDAWLDFYRHGALAGAERYDVFVLRAGRPTQRFTLGDATQVDSLARRWRAEVIAGRDAAREWAALQAVLWQPLEAAIGGRRHVYIAADGALVTLPLGLLSRDSTQQIALVSSPRELVRLVAARRAREAAAASDSGTRRMLVVGNPDFGAAPGSTQGFAPLPGTATEAQAVAALARRAGITVRELLGDDATDVAVRDALPAQQIVHLATHGIFGGSESGIGGVRGVVPSAPRPVSAGPPRNPLLESGLAFAGANLAATSGSGRITAEELLAVNLRRAQLVVLSACETGLGAQVSGQGVLGLQSALLAAGARGVVMSLWKVPDESTALLMTEFYRGLLTQGLSPAAALSRAQQVLRRDPRYAAPVHWAAWVLTGDVF